MISWPDAQTRAFFFCLVQITFYSHLLRSQLAMHRQRPSTHYSNFVQLRKIRTNWLRSWIRQLGHFLPNKTLVSRLGILQPHSFLFKPEGTEIHELIIAKPVFKGLIITSWRHRSQATIWLSSFFTKEITALSDHIPCKNVGRKFLSRQLLNRFSKSKRVDVTALNWTICLTQYIKTEKKLQV